MTGAEKTSTRPASRYDAVTSRTRRRYWRSAVTPVLVRHTVLRAKDRERRRRDTRELLEHARGILTLTQSTTASPGSKVNDEMH